MKAAVVRLREPPPLPLRSLVQPASGAPPSSGGGAASGAPPAESNEPVQKLKKKRSGGQLFRLALAVNRLKPSSASVHIQQEQLSELHQQHTEWITRSVLRLRMCFSCADVRPPVLLEQDADGNDEVRSRGK